MNRLLAAWLEPTLVNGRYDPHYTNKNSPNIEDGHTEGK